MEISYEMSKVLFNLYLIVSSSLELGLRRWLMDHWTLTNKLKSTELKE